VIANITAKRNLNPHRPDRTYPRVVKRGRHNSYRVKRPNDIGRGCADTSDPGRRNGVRTTRPAGSGRTYPAAAITLR
jgi:hypothetical protein